MEMRYFIVKKRRRFRGEVARSGLPQAEMADVRHDLSAKGTPEAQNVSTEKMLMGLSESCLRIWKCLSCTFLSSPSCRD